VPLDFLPFRAGVKITASQDGYRIGNPEQSRKAKGKREALPSRASSRTAILKS
jgi:hypothetical protein